MGGLALDGLGLDIKCLQLSTSGIVLAPWGSKRVQDARFGTQPSVHARLKADTQAQEAIKQHQLHSPPAQRLRMVLGAPSSLLPNPPRNHRPNLKPRLLHLHPPPRAQRLCQAAGPTTPTTHSAPHGGPTSHFNQGLPTSTPPTAPTYTCTAPAPSCYCNTHSPTTLLQPQRSSNINPRLLHPPPRAQRLRQVAGVLRRRKLEERVAVGERAVDRLRRRPQPHLRKGRQQRGALRHGEQRLALAPAVSARAAGVDALLSAQGGWERGAAVGINTCWPPELDAVPWTSKAQSLVCCALVPPYGVYTGLAAHQALAQPQLRGPARFTQDAALLQADVCTPAGSGAHTPCPTCTERCTVH